MGVKGKVIKTTVGKSVAIIYVACNEYLLCSDNHNL